MKLVNGGYGDNVSQYKEFTTYDSLNNAFMWAQSKGLSVNSRYWQHLESELRRLDNIPRDVDIAPMSQLGQY